MVDGRCVSPGRLRHAVLKQGQEAEADFVAVVFNSGGSCRAQSLLLPFIQLKDSQTPHSYHIPRRTVDTRTSQPAARDVERVGDIHN